MSDISPNEGYDQGASGGGAQLKDDLQAARDKLGDAGQTVKAEAAHFAEAAREKAAEKVDQGKETVTTAVDDFAEAIRKAARELGERDQTMAAQLVGQAADGLQTLSRSVSRQSPQEMLGTVRDFGRSHPTAFIAGAVLAGVALGRFARSSAEHSHAETPRPPQDAAIQDAPQNLETFESQGGDFVARSTSVDDLEPAQPLDPLGTAVLGEDGAAGEPESGEDLGENRDELLTPRTGV